MENQDETGLEELFAQMGRLQVELAELKGRADRLTRPATRTAPVVTTTRRKTLRRLGLALLGGAIATGGTVVLPAPVSAKLIAKTGHTGAIIFPSSDPVINDLSGVTAYKWGLATFSGLPNRDLSNDALNYQANAGVVGYSDFTGVFGNGTHFGVQGNGDTGVFGQGITYGIYGTGPTGTWGSGSSYGVYGESSSVGVYGTGPTGIWGSGNIGVQGVGANTSGTYGVTGTGTSYGVYGTGTGTTGIGVNGQGGPTGVYGGGSTYGVQGVSTGGALTSGVRGEGKNIGVWGYCTSGSASGGVGVYGSVGTGAYAGYFDGPVFI